ncbi:Protein strawberry notch-like 1 [Holothuria leucospilota]|uniref:Protein strawberry notch-like 1 n=1 Tax=Holothuria leucospilota TaxID=206669 RepID=A0A9Q1CFA3_HOLLE|nr:Protein strawberry notch-like 1 [Holothuria leucospilota]
MEDLLSAALSESGLDLSFDESSNFDTLVTDGNETKEEELDREPSVQLDPSENISPEIESTSSVPAIISKGNDIPAASSLTTAPSGNKKTIIIRNLPPGITAQALSKGGKLPIKLIQQVSVSEKVPSLPSHNASKTTTTTSSLAKPTGINFHSGAVITVRVGKDGKTILSQKSDSVVKSETIKTQEKTSNSSKVIDLTDSNSSGDERKKTSPSERYVITPIALAKNFNSKEGKPSLGSNHLAKSFHMGSACSSVKRPLTKTSTFVRNIAPNSKGMLARLKTGYMAGRANSNLPKKTSTGQKDGYSPVYTNSVSPLNSEKRFVKGSAVVDDDDDEEETEEELGHTDTYANYIPSKLKIGLPHPDAVVETSSLASVEPPDIVYRVCIPEKTMDMGSISALQLEAVTYACQQHETFLPNRERAGFLIGDGAGVGKGRTVAGVIFENYLLGRKRSLWFSVSNDLKFDAQRDLKDIGAGSIPVHSLNKFRYVKINSKENGYVRKGVIFATYSALIGESQNKSKYRTRLKQILHWCGKDFDGVIVLDECHKAKNLVPSGSSKPTKTGVTVLELQKQLPKARIIYCSATGASEPRNMAYMSRLGIWGPGTPFPDFQSFIQAVEKRGVGAMEIVAMDMKLRGMYMARQLSFHGVGFSIKEIPLKESFKEMYNRSVKLWCAARDRFHKAASLMSGDPSFSNSMWGQFWSAHQRFFKYLCIAAKVKEAVKCAKEAVKMGKCVVIGLQSTGEARTLDALEEAGGELTDFVSTAKGVFSSLIEKHFPAPNRAKTAGLFGLDFHENSTKGSKETKPHNKRKRGINSNHKNSKRQRNSGSDEDVMSDSSDDSSEFSDINTEKLSSSSGLSSSEEEEEEDDDDFNPFGSSDSDDDPWLKKGTKKKADKEVKSKKKKRRKKTKEKDREEAQMQSMADSALRALGITPKSSLSKSTSQIEDGHLSSSLPAFPTATSKACLPGMDAYDRVSLMKQELMDMLEELSPILPPNTLDELIEELGGPENVAEMTGRKGRVVSNNDGNVQYESRCEMDVPLEILNLTEKKRFMDGEKYIAIISEAASSGISLQADRRVSNQKRRVHITLEIPWSADRAVQQFGRTHRSNQVSAPEYVFLISGLAGERRFASIVAKRLECLGALTHGDRRATESRDLSQFNIDNKYGRLALETVMKSIIGLMAPLVEPPRTDFFSDCKTALVGVGLICLNDGFGYATLDKDYNSLPKFLNRLLGIEVDLQNELFAYFSDTLAEIISRAKKEGVWDMGILDIISEGQIVKKLETNNFIGSFSTGTATTQLHKVSAERGLKWKLAVDLWSSLMSSEEGFYLSLKCRNGKRLAVLVKFTSSSAAAKKGTVNIYRPNLGQQMKTETLSELKKKYKKVIPDEAKEHWEDQYTAAETMCSHKYLKNRCRNMDVGIPCDTGLRSRTFYILSGSVLSVWSRVERILISLRGGRETKMQLIRVRTADHSKLVGLLIPKNCVAALKQNLSVNSTFYSETYNDDTVS